MKLIDFSFLNEKIFRNGEQQIDVDLFGIIAASNELLEENQIIRRLGFRCSSKYWRIRGKSARSTLFFRHVNLSTNNNNQ